MLRVLHTVPGLNWGGLEHRVVTQTEWLCNHNVPAWIATPPNGATWERARAAGINVLALPFPRLSLLGCTLELRAMLRTHAISVVDCHGNKDSKSSLLCRSVAGIVRTVHVTPRMDASPLHRLKWRSGYDRVVAVSHSIADRLRMSGAYFPQRDTVIGEWAEPVFFGVPSLLQPAAVLRILMVGMLRPDKGADLAIAAMQHLQAQGVAAELSIAGAPTEEHRMYATALQAEVAACGLSSAVRFLGYREDVPALLAACDVVIVPSRAEAQSRIAAQAMAAGRPVVAFAVGGLPEVVLPGKTGWLAPPSDASALAGHLAALTRVPAELVASGAAARAFAHRCLGMDDKMLATLRVYRAALRPSSSRWARRTTASVPLAT
jgi:glycosyltransferase involved in cell wall biosynthesis